MPFTTARSLSLAAPVLALLGACDPALDATDDAGPAEFRDCPSCVLNSPVLNDFLFPELHLGGLPNFDGVTLIGIYKPNVPAPYTLDVSFDEELVARSGATVIARAGALINWEIELEKGGARMRGRIVGHTRTIPSWAAGNRAISAYAIAFQSPTVPGLFINACPSFANNATATVLTIIPGQTYDRELKLVDITDDPEWVTFACADEAAYKAKRLGYDPNIRFAGTNQPASVAQQNATLKMITADYCGTGHSFTAQGTDLWWQNDAATVTTQPDADSLVEAVWTDAGALCLDTPRHVERLQVEAACDIPYCGGLDLTNSSGEWMTWAPAP